MLIGFLALLASIVPSNKTSWMRPDLFHLVIGMPRAECVKTLEQNGLKTKKGHDANHVVVDYSDERSLTLQFRRNRLSAINFEYFCLIPEAHVAFDEQKSAL